MILFVVNSHENDRDPGLKNDILSPVAIVNIF